MNNRLAMPVFINISRWASMSDRHTMTFLINLTTWTHWRGNNYFWHTMPVFINLVTWASNWLFRFTTSILVNLITRASHWFLNALTINPILARRTWLVLFF